MRSTRLVHCCIIVVFVIQACNKIDQCEEYKAGSLLYGYGICDTSMQ